VQVSAKSVNFEYCIVWFTHSLEHLVAFNTDSSTLGSIRF
jgi:hypothetical protein